MMAHVSPANQPEDAGALRAALDQDLHRPAYHFLAPANWLNDPNGLLQRQDEIHLFYQYNPNDAFHGTIHWGHAVSDDLVHWRDLPVALAPSSNGPDSEGCWSGCAVDDDGVPTLIYTGVFPQTVCLATGSADLVTWEKFAGNPVIAAPPDFLRESCEGDFRDPFVWREGDHWRMIIGCRIEGQGGLVLLYRSDDLKRWQFVGTLVAGQAQETEPLWTGTIWECPNLLDFGDRQALIISAQTRSQGLMYTFYYSGRMQGDSFHPEPPRMLVHGATGESLYAPQVTRLTDGAYLLFGWLREGRSPEQCIRAGWSGVMSLPMTVAMGPDGALALTPAPAVQSLRCRHWHCDRLELGDGTDRLLDDVQGDCLEIVARFEAAGEAEYGLKLRCSPDGREYTRISILGNEGKIVLKRDRASLDPEAFHNSGVAPLPGGTEEFVTLHLFLDRSVIEIFAAEGRTVLTGRVYPTLADSLGVALFSRGGDAVLASLDIWTLGSIW